MTARALVRDGRIVAIVGLQDFGKPLDRQETTEFLAGAEESGRQQGEAIRAELRGQPAVVAFLPNRKVWAFVAGRYVGIVAGAEEGLVDDVAIQLARRISR